MHPAVRVFLIGTTTTLLFLLFPASVHAAPPVTDSAPKGYVELGPQPSRFGFVEETLSGGKRAVKRGLRFVGNADKACANGTCENQCLHLAAKVHGYAWSGSETARTHWNALASRGVVKTNRQPPVGALVFWDVGSSGHVAVYVGDGFVVSNWDGKNGAGVYLLPIDTFENSWTTARYLGWSPPVFFGPRL